MIFVCVRGRADMQIYLNLIAFLIDKLEKSLFYAA